MRGDVKGRCNPIEKLGPRLQKPSLSIRSRVTAERSRRSVVGIAQTLRRHFGRSGQRTLDALR